MSTFWLFLPRTENLHSAKFFSGSFRYVRARAHTPLKTRSRDGGDLLWMYIYMSKHTQENWKIDNCASSSVLATCELTLPQHFLRFDDSPLFVKPNFVNEQTFVGTFFCWNSHRGFRFSPNNHQTSLMAKRALDEDRVNGTASATRLGGKRGEQL